jgi:hypothetical protein
MTKSPGGRHQGFGVLGGHTRCTVKVGNCWQDDDATIKLRSSATGGCLQMKWAVLSHEHNSLATNAA